MKCIVTKDDILNYLHSLQAELERGSVHQPALVQRPQVPLVQLLRRPGEALAQDVLQVKGGNRTGDWLSYK